MGGGSYLVRNFLLTCHRVAVFAYRSTMQTRGLGRGLIFFLKRERVYSILLHTTPRSGKRRLVGWTQNKTDFVTYCSSKRQAKASRVDTKQD